MNQFWKLISVLPVMLVMFVGGCKDPRAEDKAAIRQLMRDYGAATQAANGTAVVSKWTKETLDHYTEIVKLVLDGTAEQVRARPLADQMEILTARALATRKDLKGMDGRAFQIYGTNQGWYSDGEDDYSTWTDGMADIAVDTNGQAAWCYMLENGKRTAYSLKFVKSGDSWLFDETSAHPYVDYWIKKVASESGMSPAEVMLVSIQDFHGVEIDLKSIWQPMKK
jgi:hypothetical protein